MSENELDDELEIEEWNVRSLSVIKASYDTLALCNEVGKEIDDLSVKDDLASIPGIKKIKSLIIKPSSLIKNLSLLQAMPALETLQLYGLQLRVLDGLEWFRNGRFIEIDTGRNQSCKIDKIAETQITKLSLHYGNPEDLEVVARSQTISELILSKCPKLLFEHWQSVPLNTISLSGGVLDVLADTTHISSLKSLIIIDCRKLERFEGDNSNVTWMVIDTCNRLDLCTITTFSRVEFISIVNIKNEILLSTFTGLSQLCSLSLQECKVRVDVVDLKSSSPRLEEIFITGLKKDKGIALSKANPGVVVTNGMWSYENSSLVKNRF